VRHRAAIYALPSFARLYLKSEEGEEVQRTVDLNSCAGDVVLLHSEAATVERDYLTLRQLQPTLFDIEPEPAGAAGAGAAGLAPEARLRVEAEECRRPARPSLPPCS